MRLQCLWRNKTVMLSMTLRTKTIAHIVIVTTIVIVNMVVVVIIVTIPS